MESCDAEPHSREEGAGDQGGPVKQCATLLAAQLGTLTLSGQWSTYLHVTDFVAWFWQPR